MTTRPDSYQLALNDAEMNLMRSIARFSVHRIHGSSADSGDCRDAASDLLEFADICDSFMQAYGKYLYAHGAIYHDDLKHFDSPVRDAIDGFAEACLTQRAHELAEEERDGLMAAE